MSCLEVRALLPLEPLDVLEEDERTLVRDHVATCTACASESREHGAAVQKLQAPRSEDDPREGTAARVWEKLLVEAKKPAAAAPAPEAKPVALAIALVCSFCHDALARNEACYCASCLAPHHEECFRGHGRCSAYGCEETRTVRPQQDVALLPPPKKSIFRGRRSLPGTILSGAILIATGGLGAAAWTRWQSPDAKTQLAQGTSQSAASSPQPTVSAPDDPPPPPPSGEGEDIRKFLEKARASTAPVGSGVIGEVTVEDADLRDVMDQIARRVGVNILVDPDVHEKVTLSLRSIPWRDCVDIIAKMSKCDVRTLPGGTLVLEQPPKVTIQFVDANIRTVLQLLAAYSGKNIVVSPEVHGDVTLDLHEVNYLTALLMISRALHCHVAMRKDILLVTPEPCGADEITVDEEPLATFPLEPEPNDKRTVDLVCEDKDLRDVCDDLGRDLHANLIVEPDIHEKVTANLRKAPFFDALVYLSRACKVSWERRGSIILATQPPKVTLQASRTPAKVWFNLLAAYAGQNIVVGETEPQDEVTLDLHGISFRTALEETAWMYGYSVTEDKSHSVIRVNVDPTARARLGRPVPCTPAKETTVEFPGGRKLALALEAILIHEGRDGRACALISGKRYETGESLADKEGHPVPVRVARIGGGVVVLEAYEDAGTPRVALVLQTPKAPAPRTPGPQTPDEGEKK